MKYAKTIVFLGGAELLCSLIEKIKELKKYNIIVFTSKRHISEKINRHGILRNFLKKTKINFYIRKKITTQELKKKTDIKNSLFLSVGAAWIFKSDLINLLNGRFFNIHGSKLPSDRGGGGFTWQILQENAYGYSTIHKLVTGIDKGEIIYQKKIKIKNCKSPEECYQIYVNNSKKLFVNFTKKFFENIKMRSKKQNEKKSSYWPRLNTKIHGWINWSWNGNDIQKFIKGFDNPYPGAHTFLNKKLVYLKNSKFINGNNFHPFQSGIIFKKNKDKIFISVNKGTLIINKILDIVFQCIQSGRCDHTSLSHTSTKNFSPSSTSFDKLFVANEDGANWCAKTL